MNPKQIEEFFHLSPIQKQFLEKSEQITEPGSSITQFLCSLDGPLDVPAFKRAWQKITDRNSGLRLTFASADLKEPVQIINKNVSADFEEQDWRSLSQKERQQRYQKFLQTDRNNEFPLKTPPLWRITLLRIEEQRFWLVWTYHHILLDQASLRLLLNELLAYYEAIHQARNLYLIGPPTTRGYIDWIKTRPLDQAAEFWRTALKNYTPHRIPAYGALHLLLDVELLAAFQQFAAQWHGSLETVVQGAWALCLSQETQQTDLVIGLDCSGRGEEISGIERMIGQLRNTVPFRIQVEPEMTVSNWLLSLQQQKDLLRRYDFCSLTQIRQWLGLPKTELIASEILFAQSPVEDLGHGQASTIHFSQAQVLRANTFATTLFVAMPSPSPRESATTAPVINQLRGIIARMLRYPTKRVADLLRAEEMQRTPSTAIVTSAPPEDALPENEQGWVTWIKSEQGIDELLTNRARQMPNHLAVCSAGETLTYRELQARANQLARYLHRLGVAPQVPVGIWLGPSPELAVALFGILKAGGAYLASDGPELQDSGPLLQDVAPHIWITNQTLAANLVLSEVKEPADPLFIYLDRDWNKVAQESNEAFEVEVSDAHPACFLSNAHSESRPYTHAELARALSQTAEWFQFGPDNPWHLSFPQIHPEPPTAALPLSLTPTILPLTETKFDPDAILELAPEPVFEPAPEDFSLSSSLSPMQQWFFEQAPKAPHHWNVSLLVEVPEKWEEPYLRQALRYLHEKHENLRCRFTLTEWGWESEIMLLPPETPFEYVDLSTKWAKSQRKAIEEVSAQRQTGLDLTSGPLWQVVYFDLGARADRLLVIFHELIGDENSLRIFLEDLFYSYRQIREAQLPALHQTASYEQWRQALLRCAGNHEIQEELMYWGDLRQGASLPIDHPAEANTYATLDRVFVSLNQEETQSLLKRVPAMAQAETNEIVLTALALALARWSGESSASIEIEREMRQNSLIPLDVSHTIGCFTTRFPASFTVGQAANSTEALSLVRDQWRSIPNQGLGYGLLRFGGSFQIKKALREVPLPRVNFRLLENLSRETWWQPAKENVGIEHDPHNQRPNLITVTGTLNLGMLEFQWSYPRGQFEQKNIGTLVNGFIEELQHLISQFRS